MVTRETDGIKNRPLTQTSGSKHGFMTSLGRLYSQFTVWAASNEHVFAWFSVIVPTVAVLVAFILLAIQDTPSIPTCLTLIALLASIRFSRMLRRCNHVPQEVKDFLLVLSIGAFISYTVEIWGDPIKRMAWVQLMLIYCFVWLTWFFSCLGITIGFHRYITHRSFKFTPQGEWAKKVILACGCMAFQGSMVTWGTDHIQHHKESDLSGRDLHSPVDGKIWSHDGWLRKKRPARSKYALSLLKDPTVKTFQDIYFAWFPIRILIGLSFGLLIGIGWHGVLWSFVALFMSNHSTWAVNSLAHFWGDQDFLTGDYSRNVRAWWLPDYAVGEENHCGHHMWMWSAIHGLLPGDHDISGWILLFMEKQGWVTELKRPTHEEVMAAYAEARAAHQDGTFVALNEAKRQQRLRQNIEKEAQTAAVRS